MFRKPLALASDAGLSASISLRQNFAPLVRAASAGVRLADLRWPSTAHQQSVAHYAAREYSQTPISFADNSTSPGTCNPPVKLAFCVRRHCSKEHANLFASSTSLVWDLKNDIMKELPSLRDLDMDRILLELQVAAGDGTTCTAEAGGCAAETKLVPLVSRDIIYDALTKALGRSVTSKDKLRIFVDVAGTPRPGSTPFDPALGIDNELWKVMSQEVQDRASLVVKERRKLAAVPMLNDMRAKMTAEQAERNLVNVLQVHGDDVKLGVFDVPAVISGFFVVPYGFGDLNPHKNFTLFVTPERAALVKEFLEELDTGKEQNHASGVLLSGPTGVGKSAVGLLAYLCCLAQGRFAVYIHDSFSWRDKAGSGLGDEFLVECFFLQNLDLIAAEPALRRVFDARFCGVPIGIDDVLAFRQVLKKRPGPAVAVIVDNVQLLVKAIESASPLLPHTVTRGNYFSQGWSNWNNDNSCFVRMDIGTHGMREFNLPPGDERRLRFVRPWSLETAAAAIAQRVSPAFVVETNAHSSILRCAGGNIRHLLRCKQLLLSKYGTGAPRQCGDGPLWKRAVLMENRVRFWISYYCYFWLNKDLDDNGRRDAGRAIVSLFRGQVPWSPLVKSAYDDGLVALTDDGKYVEPVSAVAASVLLGELAELDLDKPVSLSSLQDDVERGCELLRQVSSSFARLIKHGGIHDPIETLRLNGKPGPYLDVRFDYTLPFHEAKGTLALPTAHVLYVPDRDDFGCDFILVPAPPGSVRAAATSVNDMLEEECSATRDGATAAAAKVRLQVWDCCVSDPRSSESVEKYLRWFKSGGLISSLQAVHRLKPITVVLCWPGLVEKSNQDKFKVLEDTAAAFKVKICVLDSSRLENILCVSL